MKRKLIDIPNTIHFQLVEFSEFYSFSALADVFKMFVMNGLLWDKQIEDDEIPGPSGKHEKERYSLLLPEEMMEEISQFKEKHNLATLTEAYCVALNRGIKLEKERGFFKPQQ
jgi:hypothetical protein